jgi:hypothetical protein
MAHLIRKQSTRKTPSLPRRSCRDCGSDVPAARTRCPHCGSADVEDEDPTRPSRENFFVATIGAEVNNIRRPDA